MLPVTDADAIRVFEQLMTDIGINVTDPLHKACFRLVRKQFKPGISPFESDIEVGAPEVRHSRRVRHSDEGVVCACACACVCVRVRACVCVRARARARVFAPTGRADPGVIQMAC